MSTTTGRPGSTASRLGLIVLGTDQTVRPEPTSIRATTVTTATPIRATVTVTGRITGSVTA